MGYTIAKSELLFHCCEEPGSLFSTTSSQVPGAAVRPLRNISASQPHPSASPCWATAPAPTSLGPPHWTHTGLSTSCTKRGPKPDTTSPGLMTAEQRRIIPSLNGQTMLLLPGRCQVPRGVWCCRAPAASAELLPSPPALSQHPCRVIPSEVQEFALILLEFHEIAVGSSLQLHWAPRWRAMLLLLLK